MSTPAQDFRQMFEATTPRSSTTPAQAFREAFLAEQAQGEGALYISPNYPEKELSTGQATA